jgi:Restriction endonuclease
MTTEEAKALLADAEGDEPVVLPPSVLDSLTAADVPAGVSVEVGTAKDGIVYINWEGCILSENGSLFVEGRYSWTRKYWGGPLGLPHYLDLVRRTIESQGKEIGNVTLIDFEDDGAWVHLSYKFPAGTDNLAKCYTRALKVRNRLEEAAEQATAEVGKLVAGFAQRISGWDAVPLSDLVKSVDASKDTDQKGRALESLAARLFEAVPGFTVTGRVRTATEEIDISILNDSQEPRLRREEALILVECKNWSGQCGKNEFVIFHEKLENRSERCSLGFLISWNGFTSTVTKEMLRGSRERNLVVPLDGASIREAVRDSNFLSVMLREWQNAVNL